MKKYLKYNKFRTYNVDKYDTNLIYKKKLFTFFYIILHFGGPNINYNIVLYQRDKNKRKIKLLFCTKEIKIRENYYFF